MNRPLSNIENVALRLLFIAGFVGVIALVCSMVWGNA